MRVLLASPPRIARLAVPALVVAAWLLVALARLAGAPESARIAVATLAVLLAPGFAAWRALAPRRPAAPHVDLPASVILGLAVVGAALAATFAAGASLGFTLGLVLAASLVLAALAARGTLPVEGRPGDLVHPAVIAVVVVPLGLALARLVTIDRDAPFHVGRVRKLANLDALSVDAMAELAGGSTHAGYAFPLWHAVVALAARAGDVDPTTAYRLVTVALVPLAALLAYALARTVLGDARLGALAAVAAVLLGLVGLDRPAWALLADPPSATVTLAFPALLTAAALHAQRPTRATLLLLAAGAGAVTVLHPTYLPYAALVLAGAAAAVAAQARRLPVRALVAASAAVVLPFVLYTLWLLPLVRDTNARMTAASLEQSETEKYLRLGHIVRVEDVILPDPRRLAFSGVALLALCALPAVAALRGRAAAAVLGGAGAVLAVLLVPPFFDVLSDVVSLSQSRRVGAFLPRPLLLAAGLAGLAVLARRRPLPLLAASLAVGTLVGVALSPSSGAALALVIAAAVAAAAALAVVLRRDGQARDAPGLALAAGCLALAPAAVAVAPDLVRAVRQPPAPDLALPAPVTAALRALPARAVVAADLQTSYLVPAVSEHLVFAGPVVHVANSRRNDPYGRREVTQTILGTGTAADVRRRVLRERGIGYLLLAPGFARRLGPRLAAEPGYQPVFRGAGYLLLRATFVPAPTTARAARAATAGAGRGA
jgi:hypothetical protein